MLEIGVNTYASIKEVESYIISSYGEDSEYFTYWDELDSTSKEMLLKKSLMQIENLPFTGVRKYKNQALEFPRTHGNQEELVGSITIPDFAKFAQIDNAIAMFTVGRNSEMQNRVALQRNGVTSFKLGDFSETYGNSNGSILELADQQIIKYFTNWLYGGYRLV